MATGSRKDAERTRRERAEQARKATQRGERRRGLLIWGGVGLALVLIAGAVAWGLRSQSQERAAFADRVEEYDEVDGVHVTSPVEYDASPPVGGKHNPAWLNCGVYDEPVPDENAVHSLEHGAVWVTYDPDLPAADVERLESVMPPTYAILSPYEGEMPGPVVASSWGRQIVLEGADDPALEQYLREYSGSSDVPEPGALCTSGTDVATPLDGEPVAG
ncbi:DUF3105 domain-containing protein [Nocardioides marmoraquaticus]